LQVIRITAIFVKHVYYIYAEKYKYLYIIPIIINCNSEVENCKTYKAIQAEVTTVVNV